MNWVIPLLIGLLIGWLIEWVIDLVYWRQQAQNTSSPMTSEQNPDESINSADKLALLEAQIDQQQNDIQVLEEAKEAASAEIQRLETALAAAKAQKPEVIEKIVEVEKVVEVESIVEKTIQKDDLTKVNGIGPAFAKRLNAANISTFAQLAAQSPEKIHEIIKPQSWQKIEPEAWVAEAKTFAQAKNKEG